MPLLPHTPPVFTGQDLSVYQALEDVWLDLSQEDHPSLQELRLFAAGPAEQTGNALKLKEVTQSLPPDQVTLTHRNTTPPPFKLVCEWRSQPVIETTEQSILIRAGTPDECELSLKE